MSGAVSIREDANRDLARFLRESKGQIIHEWEEAARKLPRARQLDHETLIDFVPPLLDAVANTLDQLANGEVPETADEPAQTHAHDRLQEGFDLEDVFVELSMLRDTILRVRESALDGGNEYANVRILDQAIDQVMLTCVKEFNGMSNRLLKSLDRISQIAMSADDLDELLERLVEAVCEQAPSVDVATILLRSGDVLQARSSVGLRTTAHDRQVKIGEGFAGTIAQTRQPMEISDAMEANLLDDDLRRAKIQTLYGVPLIDAGELIGVAQMGSTKAPAFSETDRILFASMATRATAAITQRLLREASEARAKELAESELRFRATFEGAALGIAHVAPDGTWIRLNKRYYELLGYSPDELLGLSSHAVTHPDDYQIDSDINAQLRRGELDEASFEKRYIRKDGAIIWVQKMMAVVRDADGELLYLIAAANDISEQKRLRDHLAFLSEASVALAESLDYRVTLELVTQLAVKLLADWCVITIEAQAGEEDDFVALAHRDPSKMARLQEIMERYPPRPIDALRTKGILSADGADFIPEFGPQHLDLFAQDDNHRRWLEELQIRSILTLPLKSHGAAIGAISILTDTSHRPLDEIDLTTAQELASRASIAIESARLHEEEKQSVRLRDRILAVVAHDLRSPLSAIDMSSTLIAKSECVQDDPQALQLIERIQRGVGQSKRLIEDLLDMSSIQAGKLALDLGECDLNLILAESAEIHAARARECGIDFDYRPIQPDRHLIRCDHDRLGQVLANLLGNAIKFCSDGDRVELSATAEAGSVTVTVADTGPGIAAADLPNVFDIYWRSADRPGSGLGLFISRGIIEAHGGRLTAQSTLGHGSTFQFVLPLAR